MDVIPVFECFLCEELLPEGVRIGRVWCCAAEDRIVRQPGRYGRLRRAGPGYAPLLASLRATMRAVTEGTGGDPKAAQARARPGPGVRLTFRRAEAPTAYRPGRFLQPMTLRPS